MQAGLLLLDMPISELHPAVQQEEIYMLSLVGMAHIGKQRKKRAGR